MKKMNQDNVFSCVKNKDLIFPRQQYIYKGHEGTNKKNKRKKKEEEKKKK
jgi:hypothetical protein